MSLWAIIPARLPAEGKSRLAPVLSEAERRRLNLEFFRQTLSTVSIAVGRHRTIAISRSQALLRIADMAGCAAILERSPYGLNEALVQAAKAAARAGATRVLSVSCDLPFLTPDDLRTLIAAAEGAQGLAIAADRAGSGTNAMIVSPIGAIPYRYGTDSFEAHRHAARTAGLKLETVRLAGLSFDVDTPDDLLEMYRIRPKAFRLPARPDREAAASLCKSS
jgi:2-phospho-L-lactate guanylyltransferase